MGNGIGRLGYRLRSEVRHHISSEAEKFAKEISAVIVKDYM